MRPIRDRSRRILHAASRPDAKRSAKRLSASGPRRPALFGGCADCGWRWKAPDREGSGAFLADRVGTGGIRTGRLWLLLLTQMRF